jgi:hypothetical protein
MNVDNKAPDTYLKYDARKKNQPDSIKCSLLPRDGFGKPSPKQTWVYIGRSSPGIPLVMKSIIGHAVAQDARRRLFSADAQPVRMGIVMDKLALVQAFFRDSGPHVNFLSTNSPYSCIQIDRMYKGVISGLSFTRTWLDPTTRIAITQAMYVERNIQARSHRHCCPGKAKPITYSTCVSVALFIQLAQRVWWFILSSVGCPTLQYFVICGLSDYTVFYHLWAVRLYIILSSVGCPTIQYFVICGLSDYTVFCHLWAVRLYSILSSVGCPTIQYFVICGLSDYTVFCHLWAVRLCSIFPHYLINGAIFKKKLLNIKCVFWFSLQLLSETLHIVRRMQLDTLKMYKFLHVKCPLF